MFYAFLQMYFMLNFIFILSAFRYLFGWLAGLPGLEENIRNDWGKYVDRRTIVHFVA
jgi:hypothetical protein